MDTSMAGMDSGIGAYAPLLFWGFVFLITHLGITSTPLRSILVAKIGEKLYLALYSLLSLVLISLFVAAYNNTSHLAFIWPPTVVLHWVTACLMPFIFVLLMAGVLSPNPTLVGADHSLNEHYEVRGIFRITRHPVQWAILLWALVHIASTGDQASVIFLSLLAFLSGYGTVLIDRRKARKLGGVWQRFADMTSNVPFAAIIGGRQQLVLSEISWQAWVSGFVVYFVIWFGHVWWPVGTLLANPFLPLLGG